MLSALDEEGRTVHLLGELPKKQHFKCPACACPVRLRNGPVMRPHFAHVSLKGCQYFHENESEEHLSLKSSLYQSLAQVATVHIEKVLPHLKQVADLMVNDKLIIEIQCSRLSEERLRLRTKRYQENAYPVLWLLGKNLWLGKSLSALQKQFLYFSQNMGFHLWELDVARKEMRLKYLIYEDYHGKVHYMTSVCSFEGDILEFLRMPFRKQGSSSYQIKMDGELLTYIQKQLYHQAPKWMLLQEKAYRSGGNLMTQSLDDYFPQLRPIESSSGFCQIRQDLSAFRSAFFQYYKNQKEKQWQTLYPPAYYQKLSERSRHLKG